MIPPDNPEDYIELFWGNAAEWNWSDKKVKARVGFAVSESECLPHDDKPKILSNLKQCDLLLCASEFSSRAYLESPINCPIQIVPLGIDPIEMKFVNRDWSGTLKFLIAGAAQFRKGTWLGIEGFIRSLSWLTNAELTVWSSVKTPDREILKQRYKHKKIIFDDRSVKSASEVYAEHHILVSPHLSEGFGLQPLEAMATGMPCLVSRCSSPMEYFNDRFGAWIEMSDDFAPVNKCLKNTNGFWRLPDIDSIASGVKTAYKNRDKWQEKGVVASGYVMDNFTWDMTAKKIIDKILESIK